MRTGHNKYDYNGVVQKHIHKMVIIPISDKKCLPSLNY